MCHRYGLLLYTTPLHTYVQFLPLTKRELEFILHILKYQNTRAPAPRQARPNYTRRRFFLHRLRVKTRAPPPLCPASQAEAYI